MFLAPQRGQISALEGADIFVTLGMNSSSVVTLKRLSRQQRRHLKAVLCESDPAHLPRKTSITSECRRLREKDVVLQVHMLVEIILKFLQVPISEHERVADIIRYRILT